MKNESGQLIGETTFKPLRIGGGGFVTGISISDDGATKAVCMDVYNAYLACPTLFGDDEWRPIFTSESLDASEYDPRPNNGSLEDGTGCSGVAVAPSNYRVAYAGFNAFMYRIDIGLDGSITATRVNRAAKRQFANTGSQRNWNDRIAVHPTDEDIALFGTTNDGVTYTTDGGATTAAVAGTIPANTDFGGHPTPYLVAIAPNGTDCYIMVQGTGLYRSTTGVTGTFTLMSGSPTLASAVVIDPTGIVYVCNPSGTTGSSVSKYDGSWSTLTIPGIVPRTIAINPLDTTKMAALDVDGKRGHSINSGSSWTVDSSNGVMATSDIAWLTGGRIFPSKIVYDPVTSDKLWCSNGLGVAHAVPGAWAWAGQTRGIEELVANNGLSVPGKPGILLGCWDKPIWKREKANFDSFSETYRTTDPAEGIVHCWQLDYAADDPDYIAAKLTTNGGDRSGYSEDGGDTWARFFPSGYPTGQSGGVGGALAVNRKLNQILVPGNNQRAIYTKDGWATWDYLPIDPNIGGMGNWINANYVRRNLVTADKERDGVFAIIMNGSNQGTGVHGLHVTTNGGDNWTRTVAGRIDSTGDSVDFYHCTLAYIPGKSGELLYTSGRDYNSRLLHFTGDGVTTSRVDVGAPWGITKVSHFTFGAKADAAQSYPTIYFVGECDSVFGFHRTTDFFATKPTLLSRFPTGSIDTVNGICADANKFGRLYVGWSGYGWTYGDYGKRFELI